MKNSGIEWIGEIPDDWESIRLKYIYSTTKAKLPKQFYDDKNLTPYLSMDFIRDSINTEPVYAKDGDYCSEEDILILWDGSNAGEIVFNHPAGYAPSTTAILKKLSTQSLPVYDKFYLKALEDDLRRNTNGMGIPHVNGSYLNNSLFLLPPKSTQQRIATYLDKKCSKIEETIQNQQQVIEKLKAYKQSLITEAVTGKVKIVNGKVCGEYENYNDSGVEWIGKIPSEWVCVQIKNIFRFLGGYAFNSEDYVDETEYQILRIGNVKDFKILFDASPVYISKETAFQVENFKLRPGYILFTMTGTRGKKDYFYTHEITKDDCKKKNIYLNQRVGCLIPKTDIDSSYFNYLLKDNLIKDSVFLNETGTANQANIGSEDVMKIKVHCPPKEAQKEIASYLDKKCTVIDTAIAQKQKLIEKLTEYKKSLIYECVTGKKEI